MRRTFPFAVAIVAAMVMVLAVMVGVGIGQSITRVGPSVTSHGGTPSDVYSSEIRGRCVSGAVRPPGAGVLPIAVTVGTESNLLVRFTTNLQEVGNQENATLELELLDAEEQVVDRMGQWNVPGGPGSAWVSGSAMWTFANVAPGNYTVRGWVSVGRYDSEGGAIVVTNCALAVFVTPVAA